MPSVCSISKATSTRLMSAFSYTIHESTFKVDGTEASVTGASFWEDVKVMKSRSGLGVLMSLRVDGFSDESRKKSEREKLTGTYVRYVRTHAAWLTAAAGPRMHCTENLVEWRSEMSRLFLGTALDCQNQRGDGFEGTPGTNCTERRMNKRWPVVSHFISLVIKRALQRYQRCFFFVCETSGTVDSKMKRLSLFTYHHPYDPCTYVLLYLIIHNAGFTTMTVSQYL